MSLLGAGCPWSASRPSPAATPHDGALGDGDEKSERGKATDEGPGRRPRTEVLSGAGEREGGLKGRKLERQRDQGGVGPARCRESYEAFGPVPGLTAGGADGR